MKKPPLKKGGFVLFRMRIVPQAFPSVTTPVCGLVRNDKCIITFRADFGAVSYQVSMSLRGARSATWQSVLLTAP